LKISNYLHTVIKAFFANYVSERVVQPSFKGVKMRSFWMASGFVASLAVSAVAGNFTLLGAFSLPQGDLGDSKKANAENGFGVGGDFSVPLQASNQLFITTTGLFIHNAENTDDVPSGVTYDAGGWNNISILSGVKFVGNNSPTMAFYGLAQIGLNFALLGDEDLQSSGYGYDIDETTSYEAGTSLALAFGGGVEVNRFNIGLRYLILGKPKLKYEITDNTTGDVIGKGTGKLSISILALLVGFSF
jgi:hypothetical protein